MRKAKKSQIMKDQPEIYHDVILLDGRTAHCWEAGRQEYKNCVFSSGLVEGIEPDTIYLRFYREGEDEPTFFFYRPDEAQAVAHLLTGALWSLFMMELEKLTSDKVHLSNK